MDEHALAEQAQACQRLGCGNLRPSQCVVLIRRFLSAERQAARARQLAGVPLEENVRKGRAPTAWERIGRKLGLSGRTTRKIWTLALAIEKDPVALGWLMKWADQSGVDGPFMALNKMERGWPTWVNDKGERQLERQQEDDPAWTDQLRGERYAIEALVGRVELSLRRVSAEDSDHLLASLLSQVLSLLWRRTEAWPPGQLKATFGRFVDTAYPKRSTQESDACRKADHFARMSLDPGGSQLEFRCRPAWLVGEEDECWCTWTNHCRADDPLYRREGPA
jgi:hypothetical protein